MSIFVIDDHPLMREAVAMLIRRLSTQANVVELDSLTAVQAAVITHGAPRLICLDLKLPDTQGVEAIAELKAQFENATLVVISAYPAAEYEARSLESGADAYVQKSAGATEIANVLRPFMNPEGRIDVPVQKLSKRQKQLLVMIDKGMSNRDIAEELEISEHTVKVHLWRLFRRLNVKSRSQAGHLARQQGML
ncbi:MAG: response regulator transcription factor [Polaromonas sp.]|nr:response regulator transcription factor [Polaromonas sp.]